MWNSQVSSEPQQVILSWNSKLHSSLTSQVKGALWSIAPGVLWCCEAASDRNCSHLQNSTEQWDKNILFSFSDTFQTDILFNYTPVQEHPGLQIHGRPEIIVGSSIYRPLFQSLIFQSPCFILYKPLYNRQFPGAIYIQWASIMQSTLLIFALCLAILSYASEFSHTKRNSGILRLPATAVNRAELPSKFKRQDDVSLMNFHNGTSYMINCKCPPELSRLIWLCSVYWNSAPADYRPTRYWLSRNLGEPRMLNRRRSPSHRLLSKLSTIWP